MRRPPLILHYHAVGDIPRRHDPHNLVIDPEQLTVQLRTVQSRGYRFVPLGELVSALPGRSASGLAALTFDDGSANNLSLLPALLARFQAPATVYACPGLLGQPHHAMAAEAQLRLLTAAELRELAARPGFEIGAHTVAHTDLIDAGYGEALGEMRDCKGQLEELIGRRVDSFAYPFCTYSEACPSAARAAGYENAVTCGNRGSWERFELRRVSPDRIDSRLTFALRTRYLLEPLRSFALTSAVGRRLRRGAVQGGQG